MDKTVNETGFFDANLDDPDDKVVHNILVELVERHIQSVGDSPGGITIDENNPGPEFRAWWMAMDKVCKHLGTNMNAMIKKVLKQEEFNRLVRIMTESPRANQERLIRNQDEARKAAQLFRDLRELQNEGWKRIKSTIKDTLEFEINIDKPNSADPVHLNDDKWWFWDETWTERHGPFKTKDEARKACVKYSKTL
ncbi:MAG: hypothetical protein Q8K86_11575 [Candidatus Nanopelagicaceae bacterium]|nr:hypothetical protein [Candidatus Nanopelagicaceae bacterium]